LLFLQRFTTPKTGFLSFFALQVPQISFEPYGAFKAVWVACHFLAQGVFNRVKSNVIDRPWLQY